MLAVSPTTTAVVVSSVAALLLAVPLLLVAQAPDARPLNAKHITIAPTTDDDQPVQVVAQVSTKSEKSETVPDKDIGKSENDVIGTEAQAIHSGRAANTAGRNTDTVRLKEELREVLRQQVELLTKLYTSGIVKAGDVISARNALLEADLAEVKAREQRADVLNRHLAEFVRLQESASFAVQDGTREAAEAMAWKAARIRVEIVISMEQRATRSDRRDSTP